MKKYKRPSWDEYFFNIMDAVALRATCSRGSRVVYSKIITCGAEHVGLVATHSYWPVGVSLASMKYTGEIEEKHVRACMRTRIFIMPR